MFLDPDPSRAKQAVSASLFLPPQMPAGTAADQRWRTKRKPFEERPQSQKNQQKTIEAPEKPTIRLITQSPSPSLTADGRPSLELLDEDFLSLAKEVEVQKHDHAQSRFSGPELVQEASVVQGPLASNQDIGVSSIPSPTNEKLKLDIPPSITLLPRSTTHVVPKTAWHRRSGSSGNYSQSSTLKEGDCSFVAYSRGSKRLSQGTTLRGTPTPTELEHRERIQNEETETRQGPAEALQTLQEASPERPTIRAVPPSVKSTSTEDHIDSRLSESSLPRPQTANSVSDAERTPEIPRTSSVGRSSTSSAPAPSSIRQASSPPAPREQRSQESIAQSESAFPEPSSPIIVIFDSDPVRVRSQSQPLRFTPSVESIQARLQYPSVIRLQTGRGLSNSSSWASLRPSSSTDTLPSLRVPKKRSQHKPTSLSLGSGSDFASSSRMDPEDLDYLPYPRQQFSSHLSTIASESDRQSRSLSQHLSQFSLGSGVLTGDDASSMLRSDTWSRRRRESAPVESMPLESFSAAPTPRSGEEPGDMTLGVFREESAKPQPLFKAKAPDALGEGKRYDGPLPPLPPIPKSRDSDENFDTVSELQSPSLKAKRSAHSVRQRSNSTPSRSNSHSRGISQVSYIESERGSHASSIFPIWAKHFYGGTAHLLSASKISLGIHTAPTQIRPQHLRNDSQWTERSITSRLGTGYNEIDSPTSSHFLPSIFRPRTRSKSRARANTEGTRRSKKSRPSRDDDSRPNSLAIFNDPFPANGESETLPSGQPKWGKLQDDAPPMPPLPRKYSKQKHWNEMQYPRPMTKDRLSEFAIDEPHLAPTKRTTNRLSAWRPPSFVDSLDTLVRRCNRQILLFALGFVCPLLWMLAAVLPLPKKPISQDDFEKSLAGSEEDVQAAMMKHNAGDAERRWREEKQWMKARWWRALNRIMSVIGVLVIGAVVSLQYMKCIRKHDTDRPTDCPCYCCDTMTPRSTMRGEHTIIYGRDLAFWRFLSIYDTHVSRYRDLLMSATGNISLCTKM